jgi:ppGpp synthetase/RelA/SpoT-type nucleotidyltranferase
MGVIEDFIARYRKEYDFYDQVARLVGQTLEANLQTAGIRSMVTSRAKSISRLESKVRQRSNNKHYNSVEDIFSDIVDLAGARVALYFPGERGQVDILVKSLFNVIISPKEFPDDSPAAYQKRFSGYRATHYRVQLKESELSEVQKRYADARVEIQVASVLMHAWAEVEHDLVYKPSQGQLSPTEYSILDELNGEVIAGEISLELLQKAGEARVAATDRPFSNHYDLAAYLVDRAGPVLKTPLGDNALGRVDLLFELLTRLDMATPGDVAPYISALSADTERRPVAEQIVDQILAQDESRYHIYEQIRTSHQISLQQPQNEEPGDAETNEVIGAFVSQWMVLERKFREIATARGLTSKTLLMPTGKFMQTMGLLPESTIPAFDRIRRLRNSLVHGTGSVGLDDLREATLQIQEIVNTLPRQ